MRAASEGSGDASSRPLPSVEPNVVDVALDAAALELALRRTVVDRLRIYTGFAACWGIGQQALFWLLHPGLGAPVYVATLCFAAIAGAVFAVARRLPWSSSAITGLGVAVAVIQMGIQALVYAETGEALYLYISALVLTAAGALLLHLRWTIVFVLAGSAIVIIVGQPPHLASAAVLLAAAGSTGTVIHLVGRRYVVDIELLRQRDHHHKVALEHALADARTQLAERERAETERAQLRDQLIQAQKMESLGTLAGGFAHDMNNVLGSILAIAELLREDVDEKERPNVDDLIAATQRGAELTRNLLGFARRGHYRKQTIELRTTITDLIRILQRTVPKGVVFESVFDDPCPQIQGDPAQLTQAIINLCLNAVDAMRGVGTLRISVGAPEPSVPEQRMVTISVADTGCGMTAETRRRMFEPFFTTKGLGRGTGLGLAMVYGTVKAWGGTIDVESEVGEGTTITLSLPAGDARATTRARKSDAPPAAAKGTVLIVDDDAQIRRVARRILTTSGYEVHEACDGADAVKVFEAHRATVQLVILDMAMPVMGGAACFRALRSLDPQLRILLASGYALEEDARCCLSEGALGFVDKPYTVDSFRSAVAAAMRGEIVGTAA